MLANDLAPGNIITGPTGDFVIAGRLQGSEGSLLVLEDQDTGLCALVNEFSLIERTDYNLHTKQAASGAATVQQTGEMDAMRSEVTRLTELAQALINERNVQPANSVGSAGTDPAPVDPTPVATDAPPTTDGEPVPSVTDPADVPSSTAPGPAAVSEV